MFVTNTTLHILAWSEIIYVFVNYVPRTSNKNIFEITNGHTKIMFDFVVKSSLPSAA